MKIHVTPGLEARAAAEDLIRDGAVGIDDIGENLHDVVREEILAELGHAAEALDIRVQRVATALGPVFVLRVADIWSSARARKTVLASRGG
jgi:hypothetical protein